MADAALAIRDALCDRGVVSARDIETGARLQGAIEGFDLARSLETREEFERTLADRRRVEHEMLRAHHDEGHPSIGAYWRYRSATLQIEYVYERMLVVWGHHTLSARAALDIDRLLRSLERIQPEEGR